MKKLMIAALLAVIPSALMAQLSSLENAAEKTEIAADSDDVTAKELTAGVFDGAVAEGGASVVEADDGSSGLNKKDIPRTLVTGRKANLCSAMPEISKEKGKSGFMSSEGGRVPMELMGLIVILYVISFALVAVGFPVNAAFAGASAILLMPLLLGRLLRAVTSSRQTAEK